jgi:predicted transposase YbfD/YdcC
MNKLPLIKEYRTKNILGCLKCIDENQFNRNNQRKCILNVYPGKSEKSVFRGMVIPSLRDLGLIEGFATQIRLSANGKIILESKKINEELYKRCLATILLELDSQLFEVLSFLVKNGPQNKMKLISGLDKLKEIKETRRKERVEKWLLLLKGADLVKEGIEIKLNDANYLEALKDADYHNKNKNKFKELLFTAYNNLGKDSGDVVSILDLRKHVGLNFLTLGKIVTEKQFDNLLTSIPHSTNKYIISFGSPMGGEKLFKYMNSYYKTITIRFM